MIQPTVILLFAASGCAALIAEVVWFQLLQLVIGTSATSMGVLLATFMGGMCLGSFLLPRLVTPQRHPLRVYAVLELVIGASGLLLLVAVPLTDQLYAMGGGHLVLRIALSVACLLVPTMAMGATLPAIARAVLPSRAGAAALGWLYTANLAGAVAGTLLAGFYLLRRHDVIVAGAAAASLSTAAAGAAWLLARKGPWIPVESDGRSSPVSGPARPVLLVTALSGGTALAAQVVWTRLLALSFGATVYTFSLILAAFLVGLGLGSAAGAAAARRESLSPRLALAWCQILLSVAVVLAAYLLTAMPFWTGGAGASDDVWPLLQQNLGRALLVVLPGAILWGASFPLALAAAARPGLDARRLAGGVYAANTIGAIVGALAASAFLVPLLGSQQAQQVIVLTAGVSGVVALVWARTSVASSPNGAVPSRIMIVAEVAGVAASVGLAAISVVPVPAPLIAYGRQTAEWAAAAAVADAGDILYAGEGRHDFIAVSKGANDRLYYHAAGKVQASTVPEDMRLQLLLAHLSHLIPEEPSNVLVIGCGAGITAGALSLGPGVDRMVIAEIEPRATSVAARFFGPYNHQVLSDPRVSVRTDDGRHVLATSSEMYDVITTDLIDPWVKGVATLFTREFFELAKQHLRPGGVVTQFVQLYQSNREAVQTEIATFLEVFPHAIVWGNPHEGEGYDLVLLGQTEPIRIDIDALQARLDSSPYASVRASLASIGITSAVDLLASYAASGPDLAPWLRGAAINRDRNLRLQYLAGLGANRNDNAAIYREVLSHPRFPGDVFTGSAETVAALRAAIAKRSGESVR